MSVAVDGSGRLLLVSGGVIDVASAAPTFDYYISTSGSDSNSGTLASPWAITSLISNNSNNSKMKSKRVGFLPGTYNVAGTSGVSGATTIGNGSYPTNNDYCALSIPLGTSTASTYIGTSDSSGHYSPRTATIYVVSGQVSSSTNVWYNAILGCDYIASGNFYVTIDGLVINGNGLNSTAAGNEGAHIIFFHAYPTNFNTPQTALGVVVQNCELYGINATDSGGNDAAVWVQGVDGAIVQGCYIHDCNKTSQVDHCHGIEGYSNQYCQFIYNTFYNCTGGAVESKVGCHNNIAAYNYIYSCSLGTGGSNTAVFQGWDGGETALGAAVAFQIHHNIMDSCGRVSYGEWFNANHEDGFYWYNNTVYESGQADCDCTGVWGQHYNNLYVVSGNASGVATFTNPNTSPLAYDAVYSVTGGSYTGAFSGMTESGLTTGVDPKFIPGTTNIVAGGGPSQFALQGSSALINAGFTGGTSGGTVCNIGAWDGVVTQIGCGFGPYA